MRIPVLAAAVAAMSIVAACTPAASSAPSGSPGASSTSSPSGAGAPTVFPVIVSSEQVVGPNRFVFSFVDGQNAPAGRPDRTVSLFAYPTAAGSTSPAAVAADATFVWSIPDVVGVYRSAIDFAEAGPWTVEFTTGAPGAPTETLRFSLDVRAEASAIQVGEAAPAVTTPTVDDVDGDLAKLSSDTDPEPRFYELSVDEALGTGEPFVLVFATPKFCTSAACGPMLETVKIVAADFPATRVINVEPYELTFADGALQPDLNNGLPTPVPAVDTYGILSEPWLFTIDADGIVTGSFEGVVGEDELRAAFEGLASATG